MPIQVVCPACDKRYKVKDEAAGKKMRCKDCETVIPIPAVEVEEGDPWDALPGEDEIAEAPARGLPPVQRTKKPQAKAKGSRSGGGGGIPVTVMISIGICAIMIVLNVGIGIMNMVSGESKSIVGSGVRLAIGVAIIKGLLNRSNQVRWTAIILDAIGLVLGVLCLGAILVLANQQLLQQMPEGVKTLLIVAFAVQIVLWIVDLVALVSSSARDWCNQ